MGARAALWRTRQADRHPCRKVLADLRYAEWELFKRRCERLTAATLTLDDLNGRERCAAASKGREGDEDTYPCKRRRCSCLYGAPSCAGGAGGRFLRTGAWAGMGFGEDEPGSGGAAD